MHAALLVPMDTAQANHLKAYGLAYYALENGYRVWWLLNYRGGSFVVESDDPGLSEWCLTRGVTMVAFSPSDMAAADRVIDAGNMHKISLDTAPRIAVYAPPWNMPWDDAVTLALEYAGIPYTRIWDGEVLSGGLTNSRYDWLHLHHEDFTGQHGKFWMAFSREAWYSERVRQFEELARGLGYKSVQEEKKAVALAVARFVEQGGFLFAMCGATDTMDIALASIGIDIIAPEIDGTPADPAAQEKLDYRGTMAFQDFRIIPSPWIYEFSDIDIDAMTEGIQDKPFPIVLSGFSARYDPIPTMLVQNHQNPVRGFLGQTTGFRLDRLRKNITVLAEVPGRSWTTYIHGDHGKGMFTFLGGHDPEDYAHRVGEPPTNLELFPNSPGYRLILNNILFPAARTKKKKT